MCVGTQLSRVGRAEPCGILVTAHGHLRFHKPPRGSSKVIPPLKAGCPLTWICFFGKLVSEKAEQGVDSGQEGERRRVRPLPGPRLPGFWVPLRHRRHLSPQLIAETQNFSSLRRHRPPPPVKTHSYFSGIANKYLRNAQKNTYFCEPSKCVVLQGEILTIGFHWSTFGFQIDTSDACSQKSVMSYSLRPRSIVSLWPGFSECAQHSPQVRPH